MPLKVALVGELVFGLQIRDELLVEGIAVGGTGSIVDVEAEQYDLLALGPSRSYWNKVSSTDVGLKPQLRSHVVMSLEYKAPLLRPPCRAFLSRIALPCGTA